MKALRIIRVLACLAAALIFSGRAGAQDFGLSVSNSPNPIFAGNTLTYTITVTNFTTGLEVQVTNSFSAPVQFLSATNLVGTVSNSPGLVVFDLGFPVFAEISTVTLVVQPLANGPLTNLVTAAALGLTNTTIITNVTFVNGFSNTLVLTIAGPTVAVLAGDLMTYSVSVTNAGTNSANNVFLSNSLPAGVGFISASPTNPPVTLTNNSVELSLGTLPGGAATNFSFTVQPTNAGVLTFSATVFSGRSSNSLSSTTVSTNITVGSLVTGELVATNFSTMTYDPQTGLMEQVVQLSNVGSNAVTAARVIVSGLTNTLFNAVGTNGGNPFVEYDNMLNPGQSANLTLEYFVPTRLPITVPNSAYTAVPVPAINLAPPAGTPFSITLMTNLPSGNVLIEFQAIPGRSYTILYADNPAFTNALAAQPVMVAPADRVQWIDDGPPKTISTPASAGSRFYSVLLNPQ